jgi:hypothetical protein
LRLHSLAILVLFLMASNLLLMDTNRAHAQTPEITTARNDIARAFQSIQTAEQQGASHAQLEPLIGQLNLALQLEENATSLQGQNDNATASAYALQSISISTNVSLEAQTIGSQAQSATQAQIIISYFVAVISAIFLAIVITEGSRIKKFFHTRRIMKSKIEYRGGEYA